MRTPFFLASLLAALLAAGCDRPPETAPPVEGPAPRSLPGDQPPAPPTPPLREDFEGAPRLSLFPRLGDYRPADEDTEQLALWHT